MSHKLRVTFTAPAERWSQERDRNARERIATGYTSLRVTNATAAAIRALTSDVRRLLGWSNWGRKLSPDELLGLIAAGVLEVRVKRPPGKHAKPGSRKRMHPGSS